jgi:hypothetical protein
MLLLLMLGAALAAALLLLAAAHLVLLRPPPPPPTDHHHDAPLDAAVVLGYALTRDGKLTPALQRRVKAGVRLWRAGMARHLVFSGGAPTRRAVGRGGPSEAAVMAHWALRELQGEDDEAGGAREEEEEEEGEPSPPPLLPLPARWLLEERSTSTRENAAETLALAADRGWRSLAVVTSHWHSARAVRVFRRVAEEQARGEGRAQPSVVAAGVPVLEEEDEEEASSSSPEGRASLGEIWDASVREAAAALLYRARGWI